MRSPLKKLSFLLLLLAAASPAWAGFSRNLSAPESSRLLQQREGVFILDVRTSQEYLQSRLEGARLIPIDELTSRLHELPRDRPILVYCAVGSRSSQVARFLAERNYPEVYNLYGGIWAWQLRGLPVIKGLP